MKLTRLLRPLNLILFILSSIGMWVNRDNINDVVFFGVYLIISAIYSIREELE